MKKLTLFMLTSLLIFGCTLTSFAENSKTVVYYFWNKPKCISCVKIEKYTKEVIDEFNNKNIEYKVIDFGHKHNKHYVKKYGLYTKTVVLSEVKNGKELKYKNLTQIWTKLNNEKAFKKYVRDEICKFIE